MHLSIITWADVLKCLLLLCIAIAVLFLVGSTIIRTVGRTAVGSWTSLFFSLAVGLVTATSLYAIFMTGGRTLLLLCPVLAFAFAYELRRQPQLPDTNRQVGPFLRRHFIPLLTIILVAVACFLPVFITADPQKVSFYGDDHTFYATLAAYLNKTGLENTFPDFFKAVHFDAISPYHYGDVWWLAMISRFTGLNTSMLLAFVWYPSLTVITSIGIAAVIECIYPDTKLQWWRIALIPLIVLVASGFTFLYPSFIFNWNKYDRSFYTAPKYLTSSFLIIWMFICYYRKAYLGFALAVAIAANFFLSFAIPVIMGSCLLVGFAFMRKILTAKKLLVCIAILMAAAIYPLFFYKLCSQPTSALIFHPDYRFFSISDIRQAIVGLAVANLIQLSCYLVQGVFIYLLYRNYSRSVRQINRQSANAVHILLFVLSFLVSGYVSMVAAYNRSLDYWQLYTQVLIPMLNAVFAVMILISFNKDSGRLVQTAGCIILLINFKYAYLDERKDGTHGSYITMRSEYDQAVKFIKEPQPKFAGITSIGSDTSNVYYISTQVLKKLYFLSYKFDPYINISINTPVIPVGHTSRLRYLGQGAINTAPFSIYYAQHSGHPESLGQIQLSYLKENGIHYLLTRPHETIPAEIKRYVKDSLNLQQNDVSMFYLLF